MRAHLAAIRSGLAAAILLALCTAVSAQVFERPKSWQDYKFRYTVRQERDFTCGTAALATILKFHYGMPVSEEMLLQYLLDRYPKQEEFKKKIEKGFSFEDLIFVAEKLGFKAQAAVVSPEELDKLSGPVIVQLVTKDFEHFSVLRKRHQDIAYVSDPLRGALNMPIKDFDKSFRGFVLAVWPSYIKGDYFTGLSVVRDPLSIQRALTPLLMQPPRYYNPML